VTVDPILVRDILADGAAILVGLLLVVDFWVSCAYLYERATRPRAPRCP
jgi:hypothetical protein